MPSLYELDQALVVIFNTLEDNEGELTADIEERLNAVQMDRREKLDNILAFRQELVRRSDALNAEIDRLKGLKTSVDINADRLKLYVENSMKLACETKHELPRFKVWIQKNPPGVAHLPEDITALPAEFRIPQPDKMDRKALIDAWKSGKVLPAGVEVKQNESLRIK